MTEQDRADNGFEPEITVFTCIYCAYMAIDTAGALRIKYPANVKLVKLPCTGKTDTRYLLEAQTAFIRSPARLETATMCTGTNVGWRG